MLRCMQACPSAWLPYGAFFIILPLEGVRQIGEADLVAGVEGGLLAGFQGEMVEVGAVFGIDILEAVGLPIPG